MSYLIPPTPVYSSINYVPPVNMRTEWGHLFRPDHSYAKVKLGARQLRNVFVNHYGLVINNGLLVPGCAPNIGFGSYDEGFYYPHWRKAMEQNLVCRFGKSLIYKRLDDGRTYLIIHSPWFSYYFWLTECIPRLLMVKEYLKDLVLIYPESWSTLPFVNETLALFPELHIEVIPADVHLFATSLVMPEVKPWTTMFIADQVNDVRTLLFTALKSEGRKSQFGNRIFISRKSAARKKFVNENEAEETLTSLGFDPIVMENLSFFDQIATMREARDLITITGAGTINAIFMQTKGNLIDLPHRDYITLSQYKFHFFKLCNVLKINYSVFFLDRENNPNIDHYSKQNLYFDSDGITNHINTYLNQGNEYYE